MNTGASPKGVTHTRVCLSRFTGETRHSANRVTGRSHTERGAYTIEASRANVQCEVSVTGDAHRWTGGHRSQPGGCSGSMCAMEWKSSRTPRVTHGAAELERGVVGALSSCVAPKRCRSHSYCCPDESLSKSPHLWF